MVKEIDRLRHVIRLRLNPAGEHDSRIEALLEQIPKLTAAVEADKLTAALNELTIESQGMLKEEWEKVKDEAERGKLKRDKGRSWRCLWRRVP